MSIHLQRDLDNLQRLILTLGGLVEAAIFKAIRALRERNVGLAQEVVEGDSQIDSDENAITEECLKILALHQPVAGDLRRIATAMMAVVDLERMGDLAEEIAERAVHMSRLQCGPFPDGIETMTDLALTMVRQSLNAFVNGDADLARRVIRMDDAVDDYNNKLISEITKTMRSAPELIECALSQFSVVRHVERIADHATNIAEDVCYQVEGQLIRHQPR
jgi:phosphate transport system protein